MHPFNNALIIKIQIFACKNIYPADNVIFDFRLEQFTIVIFFLKKHTFYVTLIQIFLNQKTGPYFSNLIHLTKNPCLSLQARIITGAAGLQDKLEEMCLFDLIDETIRAAIMKWKLWLRKKVVQSNSQSFH